MNHTDRVSPLVAGVVIAALVVAGLVSAAVELCAAGSAVVAGLAS